MSDAEKLALALQYAGHYENCDARMPLWNMGPCDCGWVEARKKIEEKD